MHKVHVQEIDSTSTAAMAEAMKQWPVGAGVSEGRPEPIRVWADRQTAGRGREGRTWSSPQGGLYFSLAYPWPTDAAARAQTAPLAAGLAVRHAILDLTPLLPQRVEIKWPNDVLIDDRKVAGILCERQVTAAHHRSTDDDPRCDVMVIGIGINLRGDPDQLGPCRVPATTLEAALDASATVPDAELLIDAVTDRLVLLLERIEHDDWGPAQQQQLDAALAWRNRAVTYQRHGRSFTGTLLGVDKTGTLLVQPPGQDAPDQLLSGEVCHLAAASSDPLIESFLR